MKRIAQIEQIDRDDSRSEPLRSVYLICTWKGASQIGSVSPAELSLAGCYVETSSKVRIGEGITVTVSAGLSHPLVLRGNVVSIDDGRGFEIQYVPFPAGILARLNALIEYPEDVYCYDAFLATKTSSVPGSTSE